MTILRDISLVYSSLHSLILFLILFESKFPKKKFLVWALSFSLPLLLVNLILLFFVGIGRMGTLLLMTCTIPSLIFFLFMAKYRGGRFLFTFCFSDTIVLELIYITNLLDYYLGNNYLVLFVLRLFLYPALEVLIYKFLRPTYLNLQHKIEKGWLIFAGISIIFYALLSLSTSYPSLITERPEYIPAFLLLLILMPLLYLHFFTTLGYQQKNYEIVRQESIMQLQMDHMKARMEEFHSADNKFRMERHNFRHKLQTIAGLMDKKEYMEIYTLLHQYNEDIKDTQIIRYCNHAILDSALSTYLHLAENKGISVSSKLDFPDILPVNEAELAMVFANAIENATHACLEMEPGKRHIELKVVSTPGFMFQIRNSFNGVVAFDENHIPITAKEDHGFGTRSIVAFCEKYHAYYNFKAEEDLFSLQIML